MNAVNSTLVAAGASPAEDARKYRIDTAGGGHATRRRGFTLVELVISLAIMSFLLVGLASSMLIAGHAMPSSESTPVAVVRTAEIADQIAEELRSAIWIRVHQDKRIKFTIPDRDGDGVPEFIVYRWSGTPGDPLRRNYNRGGLYDIVDSIREFDLEYEIETVTEEYPGPSIESAEILLSEYSGDDSLNDYAIKNNEWIGQYFEPTLDASAVSWKVTRVYIEAKRDGGNDGETLVQLRPADGVDLPTDTVLEEQVMYESDLGDHYAWQEFNFSNASGLSPGDGLCLVLEHSEHQPSCKIRYENHADYGAFRTNNGGDSWNMSMNDELRHYIFGTWSAPGPPQTAVRQYITNVRIALTAADQAAERVVTSAQTLNCPELLSEMWEADFSEDPTLDLNGDDEEDWLVRGGALFDTSELSGGVWEFKNEELDTKPSCAFDELTTAEVRFRSTSVGSSAVLWCNVDFAGGNFMPVISNVELMGDGTQMLNVTAGWPTQTVCANVTGLPSDFVTLRLLIDPTLNTVNVKVNGLDYGTTIYSPYPPSSDPQSATLTSWGSSVVEVDSISIRVGN